MATCVLPTGVAPSATWVGTVTPAPRSDRASFEAASLAGSAEKPLALVEPLKPELKARPERADVGAGPVAGVGNPAQPVEDRVVGIETAGDRVDAGGADLGRQREEVGAEARQKPS